jgi:F-type H+-transporting ATPase subunit delta
MKINKEIRRLSRALLRASFTDGQLDQGKIASLVQSLIEKKPRHYIAILENYRRLLRLEVEKRHARIESASKLIPEVSSGIVSNLQRKYGQYLTTEFLVNPELLGGLRIHVGSDVWDGTVRNRLERLEQNLTAI